MRMLLLCWMCLSLNAFSQSPDDGSVHVLGNGSMCIYEKGTEIITAYTGPYSTPSYFTMETEGVDPGKTSSVRQPGTAVWTHTLRNEQGEAGTLVDFVDAVNPCMVRQIRTREGMSFVIRLKSYVQVINNESRFRGTGSDGRLFVVPAGTTIYQTYVYPRLLFGQVVTTGAARIEDHSENGTIRITCGPGESSIYILGGPEYADAMRYATDVLSLSPGMFLERTLGYWKGFTSGRKDFSTLLPSGTPQREKLLKTIDEVAVLIKCQQSKQGAVLAGIPYPLGYVRDQYGVSRGLLALGLTGEAKAILNFYWQIWKNYGVIHNAQAIGIGGIFHIHENDEVEITGYLILQALDLFHATGDEAFLMEIAPMLDWAFDSQKKHLAGGMLPFNGDETYVAGGILPRSTLNDGSAEATLLFIESGQQYLSFAGSHHLWNEATVKENQAVLAQVRSQFDANFWRDGVLWTNNPLRATLVELPQYRHGVCEKAGPHCLMNQYAGIVWTERNVNGRYVCAACLEGEPLGKATPKAYNLLSASLAPIYFRSEIIPMSQLETSVRKTESNFLTTGALTSREEMAIQGSDIKTVGYDYGFLLLALNQLGSGHAREVYDKTLSVVDKEGAWSEYYLNDKPNGTRCRPWESAINLEALITWAMNSGQQTRPGTTRK